MTELPISLAGPVVRSGMRLLRAVYLIELERLERGIPDGVLTIAGGLQFRTQQDALFAVAAEPEFDRWRQVAAQALFGEAAPPRDAVLRQADEAQVARRYRRAVQLYGWLLLTSTTPDHAFQWARRHLGTLRREVYAATSEAAPC